MFTLDQAGRRSREVEVLPPPPALRAWIEHLVVDRRPAGETGRWRIVPDASGHVVVTFRPGAGRGAAGTAASSAPGPLLRASVVGARTRFVDADATPRGMTVGVRFRPGGLAAVLGDRAAGLTDRSLDLRTALGRAGREAVERLEEATTVARVLEVLTGLLSRGSASREEPDWRVGAMQRALAAGVGRGGPGGLAGATGIAPRTLRAVAAQEVGISPRRWVRIHRLFRALEMSSARPAPAWGWIAARAGYHDPPHLTREFRALLGETPTDWSRRGG